MSVFRKWRRAAVASLAAAAALFVPQAAAAQSPDGFTPSEDDYVLLQMSVRKYRLLNDIRGYQTPDGVCVDMGDVIRALDLPIRLDKKSRRATGWIFAESQTLKVERDSNTVQIVNNRRPLQPGEIYDTPEGWCVDTDTLAGWFDVRLTVDLRDAAIVLDSETPLPFIQAIERKSRAAQLRPDRDRDLSGYPQARQPYAMWRMPSVDVVAETSYHADSGRDRLETRYELFASGEVARASFDVRLASDAKAVPETLRVRAYRMDPSGGMLGPLDATQVVAGDVDMLSGNLAGAIGVGRGAFVSNRALQQPTRFGTTVLRGTLPLGWDAELYRNGQLLAYQNEGVDGRYEFEVSLIYGQNDLEVVLYGPQGQTRRERQTIPVGYGVVAPGKLEYWAGIIDRNRDLISFGTGPPGAMPLDEGWQYAAGVQYGLDRRTVIGANGHSLFLDTRRRDYAELNLQRAVGPMLLNLSAAQEFGQGRAYRLDMLGQFGKINVQAESFFVDGDFVSGIVSEDERSAHRVQFDTTVKAGRIPVPLSLGLRRSTGRDGRESNEILGRASLILPRVSLTGFVLHRDSEGAGGGDDGTRVGLLANTSILGLRARGEASYRLNGPLQGFEGASITLEKALSDRSDLRLDIEHTARSRVTEFDLAYVRQFRRFALRGSGRIDTRGAVGASLGVSFSFGPDPLRGGWRMSSDKLAQRGQAAVAVFLDTDGDGRRSPGEEALPGVGITAGQRGSADPTDTRGYAFVEGLQPYDPVLVSVDESTLPDPFLMPRGKGMVVTPRPGVAAQVELAVSPTGEVEGVLVGSDDEAMPGVVLELVGDDGQVAARAMSEYDGFFLFDRVAYGAYRLRLAPDSAKALGVLGQAMGDLATGVEVNPERAIDRLGTIRLREPTTIARARAPPDDALR